MLPITAAALLYVKKLWHSSRYWQSWEENTTNSRITREQGYSMNMLKSEGWDNMDYSLILSAHLLHIIGTKNQIKVYLQLQWSLVFFIFQISSGLCFILTNKAEWHRSSTFAKHINYENSFLNFVFAYSRTRRFNNRVPVEEEESIYGVGHGR